jgi:hypothetical protein
MTHAAVIRAANARVVIFPELSMTGYELDADAISVDVRDLPRSSMPAPRWDPSRWSAPQSMRGAGGRRLRWSASTAPARPSRTRRSGCTEAGRAVRPRTQAGPCRSPRMAPWSCDLQGYRRSTARRGHRGLGIDAYVAASRSTRTWRGLRTSVHAEPPSLTGSGWPWRASRANRWGLRAHRRTIRDMDARWGRRLQGRARARGDRTRDAGVNLSDAHPPRDRFSRTADRVQPGWGAEPTRPRCSASQLACLERSSR